MPPSPASDTARWLNEQTSFINDLFTRAAEELHAAGVRILTGSNAPIFDDFKDETRILLTPLRFSNKDSDAALALNISASVHGGPPRFVITQGIHGLTGVEALRSLSSCNPDPWRRFYAGHGLWLTNAEGARLLNDSTKMNEIAGSWLTVSAVFLHSDLSRTIQAGVMVMGLLYRGLLDELSGASRFGNLAARLDEHLAGQNPRFQHGIRP
jgi:hypothetical protein